MTPRQLKKEANRIGAQLMRELRGTLSRKQLTLLIPRVTVDQIRKWETCERSVEWEHFIALAQYRKKKVRNILRSMGLTPQGVQAIAVLQALTAAKTELQSIPGLNMKRCLRGTNRFTLGHFLLTVWHYSPPSLTDFVANVGTLEKFDSPLIMIDLNAKLPAPDDQVSLYFIYPVLELLDGKVRSNSVQELHQHPLLRKTQQELGLSDSKVQEILSSLLSAGVLFESSKKWRVHPRAALRMTDENRGPLIKLILRTIELRLLAKEKFSFDHFLLFPIFTGDNKRIEEFAKEYRRSMRDLYEKMSSKHTTSNDRSILVLNGLISLG